MTSSEVAGEPPVGGAAGDASGGGGRSRSHRLSGVDATRGLALLGMMAVHVLPGTAADGSASTSALVAGGRSAATFAVLAGVSLALATGATRPPTGARWHRSAVSIGLRALLIGAIGLGLGYADHGVAVILPYYAVLFLLAVPLLRLRSGALAVLAVVVAVGVPVLSHLVRDDLAVKRSSNPTFATLGDGLGTFLTELTVTGYYPALAWTAYLCAGMAMGRASLGSVRVAWVLLAGGSALALLASGTSAVLLGRLGGLDALAVEQGVGATEVAAALEGSQGGVTPPGTWWWLALDSPHSATPPDLLHTVGVAVALLGALLLLSRLRLGLVLLGPLAAAGGMTLSLYTAHVLLLASDWLPEDDQTSYVLQVVGALVLASLWRVTAGRGPLEAVVAYVAGRAAGSVGQRTDLAPRGS